MCVRIVCLACVHTHMCVHTCVCTCICIHVCACVGGCVLETEKSQKKQERPPAGETGPLKNPLNSSFLPSLLGLL